MMCYLSGNQSDQLNTQSYLINYMYAHAYSFLNIIGRRTPCGLSFFSK